MTTYQWVALAVLLGWPVTGLVLGVVMARRGYSGFGWGITGAFLGPLGVLVALVAHLPERDSEFVHPGRAGRGTVDVLAGIDDSWECRHAATAAVALLGPRTGRLMLATVVPIDATPDEEHHALVGLENASGALHLSGGPEDLEPGRVVLHGKPADALRRFAAEEGYDVIAIGCHGHGAAKAVLGSTADALVRHGDVPLIVSDGHGARRERRQPMRPKATVS